MAAAVSGNEKCSSYDCQWVFNKVGSAAAGVAKVARWSITSMAPFVSDSLKLTIKNAFDSVRMNIPQVVFDFSQAVEHDVKWLFNEPSQADLDFSGEAVLSSFGAVLTCNKSRLGSSAAASAAVSGDQSDPKPSAIASDNESQAVSSQAGPEAQVAHFQRGTEERALNTLGEDIVKIKRSAVCNYTEAHRCAQRVVLYVTSVALPLILYSLFKK